MKGRILIVDDERAIGLAIQRLLGGRGYDVETALSAEEALEKLGRSASLLVITDLTLPKQSGMDLLRAIRERSPETAVIMITAHGSERAAVEAMKLSAADDLPKPFDSDELDLIVDRALEGVALRRDFRLLQEKVTDAYRFERMIGQSPAMQRVFDVIGKVADTDLTVLIRGPSGTGKELVANALHYNSPRRTKPLVKVNCAAFSRELVESELFGHEKGAFTGAVGTREGKFEVADGGTLFLDEIGDMPLETQAKILRVLQEREFERVGGNRTLRVDVRVLAHQSGPRVPREGRDVSRRPLLPVERGRRRAPVAARAPGGPAAPDRALPRRRRRAARPGAEDARVGGIPGAPGARVEGERPRARARHRAGGRARLGTRDRAGGPSARDAIGGARGERRAARELPGCEAADDRALRAAVHRRGARAPSGQHLASRRGAR